MRYILYILTLALVFTGGMFVGNFYVPATNESLAAAVSVPDLDMTNPALDQANLQQALTDLQTLSQALSSCPTVVEEEKNRLLNHIHLFLNVQDFEIKKAIYEAEIAKNVQDTQTTSKFSKAAQNYSDAKQTTQDLANTLFPLPVEEPTVETIQASTQTVTSTEIEDKKSVETIASTDTVKK